MATRRRSALADEIKQTRPFRSSTEEATIALLRSADIVRRHLAGVVQQEDVTLQQYNVLRILRGAQGAPLCALEIQSRLIEEAPGVSRLIDRLVAKGLVRRERATDDRRLLECYITEEGLAVLARLDAVMEEAEGRLLAHLSAREVTTLVDLLALVRKGRG